MTRRRGLLSELSEVQETYKQMLIGMKGDSNPDKTFDEAMDAAFMKGVDDDIVIAVACASLEMDNDNSGEDPRGPEENDLFYAQDLIDHLDTLGKRIVSK